MHPSSLPLCPSPYPAPAPPRTTATPQAGHLAERLLNFVWEQVCPSAAPPELVASGALEEMLRAYWFNRHDHLPQYLERCMACLQQHLNVYPSLVLVRSIINVYPTQQHVRRPPAPPAWRAAPAPCCALCCRGSLPSHSAPSAPQLRRRHGSQPSPSPRSPLPPQLDLPTRPAVVAELFSKGKLVPTLVANLQLLMSRARAQQLAAADSPLPEQGCYGYRQLVDQYVATLQYLHEVHSHSMAPELCVLLWEQLVEQPVTAQDKASGLRFFLAGISRHNEQFISPATAGQLLREKIMRLDPAGLQQDAWHCFFEYFRWAGVAVGVAGWLGAGAAGRCG